MFYVCTLRGNSQYSTYVDHIAFESLQETYFVAVDNRRIDENMDESLVNVEGAQGQLLKYYNSISSNRWLILKIFMVLITFLLIFVVFIA